MMDNEEIRREGAQYVPQEEREEISERDEPALQEEVYRTQREVDAAFGRRLRRERERWEKKHAKALMLENLLGEQGVEEAIAALLSRRIGADAGDEIGPVDASTDMQTLERNARVAALRREAEALRREDPMFDFEAAMQDSAFRALVEAGVPLRRAYAYVNMERSIQNARDEARMETLRAIQARGVRPRAIRPQGAAGADFYNMPDEILRSIDARLKRGEKVRV